MELLDNLKVSLLKMMLFIDKFCLDNGIKYSLAYGSLIGAVRHNGFIPWDDDLDICMLRKDYDNFIKKINDLNSDEYIIESSYDYKNTKLNHSKIRALKTKYIAEDDLPFNINNRCIYIDIFPMDYVPNNEKNCKKFIRIAKKRIFVSRMKIYKKNKLTIICSAFLLCLIKPFRSLLLKRYDRIISTYKDIEDSNGFLLFSFSCIDGLFRKLTGKMMDSIILHKFENLKLSITSCYDSVLKEIYGNYNELPPENERQPKHHPIFLDTTKY